VPVRPISYYENQKCLPGSRGRLYTYIYIYIYRERERERERGERETDRERETQRERLQSNVKTNTSGKVSTQFFGTQLALNSSYYWIMKI
jgi:hypothetical protein